MFRLFLIAIFREHWYIYIYIYIHTHTYSRRSMRWALRQSIYMELKPSSLALVKFSRLCILWVKHVEFNIFTFRNLQISWKGLDMKVIFYLNRGSENNPAYKYFNDTHLLYCWRILLLTTNCEHAFGNAQFKACLSDTNTNVREACMILLGHWTLKCHPD